MWERATFMACLTAGTWAAGTSNTAAVLSVVRVMPLQGERGRGRERERERKEQTVN